MQPVMGHSYCNQEMKRRERKKKIRESIELKRELMRVLTGKPQQFCAWGYFQACRVSRGIGDKGSAYRLVQAPQSSEYLMMWGKRPLCAGVCHSARLSRPPL